MCIIEVNNLSKSYKKLIAVDNISFKVNQGEIFGMLGPNGAGKTTTIECITGIKPYDTGNVFISSLNPKHDRKALYNKVGVQFQETSYQSNIKVKEICSLFSSLYETPVPYTKLITRFDLQEKLNVYVSKLSGGQKQKLSIILALIGNPQVVFLDELTTGLDPEARRNMWEYVKKLKKDGKTVFMTTHYMEEAEYLCDRICIMHQGKIIANDTVDNVILGSGINYEITFQSNDSSIDSLLKNISNLKTIKRNENNYFISFDRDEVFGKVLYAFESNNISYKNINIKRPSLEDVFIKYTGKGVTE